MRGLEITLSRAGEDGLGIGEVNWGLDEEGETDIKGTDGEVLDEEEGMGSLIARQMGRADCEDMEGEKAVCWENMELVELDFGEI